ncbi:MAG: cytochrome C [Deltaproteobacteria bacterium]|nr:cytochrome C [Deltaproteobacteria bacterium]
MYNAGKVIIGILIFLGLFTYPIWSPIVLGKAGPPPQLEKPDPAKGKVCVEATDYMRSTHMSLLNNWRDWVVRDGNRIYTGLEGKKYNMSLQNTCLDCHKSREKFCDRCHNYVNVSPRCWECHIEPEYKQQQAVAWRSK